MEDRWRERPAGLDLRAGLMIYPSRIYSALGGPLRRPGEARLARPARLKAKISKERPSGADRETGSP